MAHENTLAVKTIFKFIRFVTFHNRSVKNKQSAKFKLTLNAEVFHGQMILPVVGVRLVEQGIFFDMEQQYMVSYHL